MTVHFRDRRHAGRLLARKLAEYTARPDVIVLALPRGGVPVGYEVARALHVPLDVFVVRKLGVPGHEELAMGAIASGGLYVRNDEVADALNIDDTVFDEVVAREYREVQRREHNYRDDRPPFEVAGKIVLLVDDGLATGSTMRAAVAALRRLGPAQIVVAVPTAARTTCEELADEADACVCDLLPEPFRAVGLWYNDFTQTEDDEVRDLLARAQELCAAAPQPV